MWQRDWTVDIGFVATSLSSNIPTGVLVDCCFLVSSAVFQLFVLFSGFTALNLPVYSSPAEFSSGGRVGLPVVTWGWHYNAPPFPPWRRACIRVEVPKAPRGGFGVFGGGYSTKSWLPTQNNLAMHPLDWTKNVLRLYIKRAKISSIGGGPRGPL